MSSGPCGGHVVGERDDLARVAQVDADHPEPVQPVGAVGHGGEAADGVVREPGRDRGVGAVAEQPQRDVHADLGAAAGEQRAPPGQVGAGVPALPVERGAVRAELVVERVDPVVELLADVAGPGPAQRAGAGALRRRAGAARRWSRRRSGPGAPVAVAAITARSAALTSARRSRRRRCLTALNSLAVAIRTRSASGWSAGSASACASTSRQTASRSGSIRSSCNTPSTTPETLAQGMIHFVRTTR